MKRVSRLLLLMLGVWLLWSATGCANVDAEDREFFYRGWLFPNRDKLPDIE